MAECAPPNIVESPAWLENLGGASRAQKSRRTFGEWHRAFTKPECAPRTLWSLQHGPKIQRSFGESHKASTKADDSKITAEDAGVGTILELRARNFQRRWLRIGEKRRALTKVECAPPEIVDPRAWLKNLCGALARGAKCQPTRNVLHRTLWSLELGSKISAELRRVAQSFNQG
ncbi:hypothetical protein C8J57DRAFT_1257676 [Mycena rebaudengoi]|nr:hypothetical protein C8J57DRAFT_1257676 [Mycena rebaudengoi]